MRTEIILPCAETTLLNLHFNYMVVILELNILSQIV